ncbi:unnamed protein product [Ceutorhynchus assimilis]|uniref:Uncharacterized protein n=1 Tax=Ceutorhynchus assimilis TaxID=467358 RepID=A0A9N9QFG9_9CUCU|nr:unnamed protein product [Ceutorhynchus assimilis]
MNPPKKSRPDPATLGTPRQDGLEKQRKARLKLEQVKQTIRKYRSRFSGSSLRAHLLPAAPVTPQSTDPRPPLIAPSTSATVKPPADRVNIISVQVLPPPSKTAAPVVPEKVRWERKPCQPCPLARTASKGTTSTIADIQSSVLSPPRYRCESRVRARTASIAPATTVTAAVPYAPVPNTIRRRGVEVTTDLSRLHPTLWDWWAEKGKPRLPRTVMELPLPPGERLPMRPESNTQKTSSAVMVFEPQSRDIADQFQKQPDWSQWSSTYKEALLRLRPANFPAARRFRLRLRASDGSRFHIMMSSPVLELALNVEDALRDALEESNPEPVFFQNVDQIDPFTDPFGIPTYPHSAEDPERGDIQRAAAEIPSFSPASPPATDAQNKIMMQEQSVSAVEHDHKVFKDKRYKDKFLPKRSTSKEGDRCAYCGIRTCKDREKCPAKFSECRSCLRRGHWSAMCRKKAIRAVECSEPNTSSCSEDEEPHNIVNQVIQMDSFIGQVYLDDKDRWYVDIIMDNRLKVPFFVDSGAEVTSRIRNKHAKTKAHSLCTGGGPPLPPPSDDETDKGTEQKILEIITLVAMTGNCEVPEPEITYEKHDIAKSGKLPHRNGGDFRRHLTCIYQHR